MSSAPKPAAAPASKKIAKKETAAVAAPVVAAPAAPAAAAPAAAKKSSKKEAAAAPAAAAVAAPAAAVEAPSASAIAAPAVEAPVTTVTQDIDSLVAQLQSVRDAAIGGLKALAKLSKRVARDIKEAGRRRRRVKAAPVEGEAPAVKRPTIFTTPVTLKDELSSFLGKPKGFQMTPADVTRAFSAYVDTHKLKDAEKGHTIHPDAAMRKVLGVKEGEALTYRNIQTYLYKLYVLPSKATATATATA
jgi:chromatin remodeling complex protein RSC6